MCVVTILNCCYLRENLLILYGLPRPSMPDISIISGYTRYLAVDPYTSKYYDIQVAQISVLVTVIIEIRLTITRQGFKRRLLKVYLKSIDIRKKVQLSLPFQQVKISKYYYISIRIRNLRFYYIYRGLTRILIQSKVLY